jgi:PD-(D/E)XK nuclease superfamily
MTIEQKTILEKFVVDNQDLERLESLLDRFNIFEAVGMVRQEIRHSSFLAFLLNPSASHRLGDIVLKAFLKRLLIDADNATVSPIAIDIADMADTEVRREWRHIDILLVSPTSQIVCAIENKVDSHEHNNQLCRYRNTVLKEFPSYRHIFVFLTLEGISPDDETDQQYWSAYSYSKIAHLIDDICNRYQSTIGSDVLTLMQHYSSLLNRHMMENSEIARLCRQIYAQHKEALDLIYEHRPDLANEIYDFLRKLVKNTPSDQIVFDNGLRERKILSYAIPSWDNLPFQKTCKGWTPSRRILLLQFVVEPPNLTLVLMLGPGESSTRQAVFDAIKDGNILGFTHRPPTPEVKWLRLVERIVLASVDQSTLMSDISEDIHCFWQTFLKDELPKIDEAINQKLSSFKLDS